MPDCNLCPTLFAIARLHPNTWVRVGLFHGRREDGQDDACQMEIIRKGVDDVTGRGRTWQDAATNLITNLAASGHLEYEVVRKTLDGIGDIPETLRRFFDTDQGE